MHTWVMPSRTSSTRHSMLLQSGGKISQLMQFLFLQDKMSFLLMISVDLLASLRLVTPDPKSSSPHPPSSKAGKKGTCIS